MKLLLLLIGLAVAEYPAIVWALPGCPDVQYLCMDTSKAVCPGHYVAMDAAMPSFLNADDIKEFTYYGVAYICDSVRAEVNKIKKGE